MVETKLNQTVEGVWRDIEARSQHLRAGYEQRMQQAAAEGRSRKHLSCSNLAHGFAACPMEAKARLRAGNSPNIGVVTAYNDMLSAHQPYESYPALIREEAEQIGATAQVAGGVPAMCDGITQGQPGMELSLFSRDVIAQGTIIALSHRMFDAALCLGICDKIVPGLLMGALAFGHLPIVMIPGGPMGSGVTNSEKRRVREAYAEGKATREELLEIEAGSYHAPGTCTFYGTANSNQLLMEMMGLHLPGASFIPSRTPERDRATRAAVRQVLAAPKLHEIVTSGSLVNALVGLLASGGSTNHTMHLLAIARAAGLRITWEDMDRLSAVVPLLARIYPNGEADINQFHAAGGVAVLMGALRRHGLLVENVTNIVGGGLDAYSSAAPSQDTSVLRSIDDPFDSSGGLRLLTGNLGRAVIKLSAVKPVHRHVEAPALVLDSTEAVAEAFRARKLHRDLVLVLRFQGPRANGMPELHEVVNYLSIAQNAGHNVALITDGRLSGASGKIPAAIHCTPEAFGHGPLACLQDGDMILLDAESGRLECKSDPAIWRARTPAEPPAFRPGLGRDYFAFARERVTPADQGASFLLPNEPHLTKGA